MPIPMMSISVVDQIHHQSTPHLCILNPTRYVLNPHMSGKGSDMPSITIMSEEDVI